MPKSATSAATAFGFRKPAGPCIFLGFLLVLEILERSTARHVEPKNRSILGHETQTTYGENIPRPGITTNGQDEWMVSHQGLACKTT